MKNLINILFLFLFVVDGLLSQELQIFKVEDFDLKGKVKSCLVITDYGRELFQFDEEGRLVSTVTQYNESDQDITYYKYEGAELVEKRMESYKDNVLDVTTSMVNFFSVYTTDLRRVSEKIISYDKEFLEQQTYEYDDQERLIKITSSNADGVDDITLTYETNKDEVTSSYFLNGVIEKSIRTSEKKTNTTTKRILLTKEFVDGEPNTAVEETFEGSNEICLTSQSNIHTEANRFVSFRISFRFVSNFRPRE